MEDLPRGSDKLDLYLLALNAFQGAGYEAIGMDHFALPEDGLVKAANSGSLHRNFMGYATHQAEDMLSFGVTSISEIAGAFAQNVKQLNQYREHLNAGRLPVERGMRRSVDDERETEKLVKKYKEKRNSFLVKSHKGSQKSYKCSQCEFATSEATNLIAHKES